MIKKAPGTFFLLLSEFVVVRFSTHWSLPTTRFKSQMWPLFSPVVTARFRLFALVAEQAAPYYASPGKITQSCG